MSQLYLIYYIFNLITFIFTFTKGSFCWYGRIKKVFWLGRKMYFFVPLLTPFWQGSHGVKIINCIPNSTKCFIDLGNLILLKISLPWSKSVKLTVPICIFFQHLCLKFLNSIQNYVYINIYKGSFWQNSSYTCMFWQSSKMVTLTLFRPDKLFPR
jgi:hypothetical protein